MGADEQNSTVSNIVNDTERCNSHKCKLLRSKLIGVTDSLLTALDDDNDNDVAVVNGAKRNQPAPGPRQAHPPVSTTSNGPVSFATVAATRTSRTRLEAPRHAPRMQSASSSPQPIPVVEIGAAARHAVRPCGGAARVCVCMHLPGSPGSSPFFWGAMLIYLSSNSSATFMLFSAITVMVPWSSSVKYFTYSTYFVFSLVILHSFKTCLCVSSSSWHRRHVLFPYLSP